MLKSFFEARIPPDLLGSEETASSSGSWGTEFE